MLNTKQKIALATVAQTFVMMFRQLLNKTPKTLVKRKGIHWCLDLNEGIDFAIWLLGSFEASTIACYKKLISNDDVVLDIGANVGAHTLHLAESVGPRGKVYAFEPTDYAFEKLQKNCSLNSKIAERIVAEQVMLVDDFYQADATPNLYSSWPLKESNELHDLHQGKLKSTNGAKAFTLDELVERLELARVDFIKLDIDGFECSFFKGAKKTLLKWRPTIIMELAPYALEEQGDSLADLLSLLRNHNYSLFKMSNNVQVDMNHVELTKLLPRGSSMNVVARQL